MKISSIRQKQ